MLSPDQKLARIAAKQYSVFSRGQALSCGFSPDQIDRRIRSGAWIPLHRGVYILAGVRPTFEARVVAALLAAGAAAVASHLTAGRLFELEGVTSDDIHVTVPLMQRVAVAGVHVRQSRRLAPRDVTTIGPIAVTRPPRTIIDLAALLPPAALEDAVDDFARRGKIDTARLLDRVQTMDRRGCRGLGVLKKVLEERVGCRPSGSRKENALERLMRKAGLPKAIKQFEILAPDGSFVARPDLAYPEPKLAIEYESYEHHSSRADWERGLVRLNKITEFGWTPMLVTEQQLTIDANGVVDQIRRRLTAAGAVNPRQKTPNERNRRPARKHAPEIAKRAPEGPLARNVTATS